MGGEWILAIRYISGRAGAGKTVRVYHEIQQALNARIEPLFLMVPEQFTLQAERDLVEHLRLPGLFSLEVVSFSRLCHKVLQQAGGLTRIHLDEQGCHMVLRRIVSSLSGKLTIFKTASKQDGFIQQFNDLLSDLKRHDITPVQLKDRAEALAPGLLKQKLSDTALLYEAYTEFMQSRYLDAEDALNLFIERIPQAGFLQGAHLWLDGFDYLPPQNLRILKALMKTVSSMTMTFTYEGDGSGRDPELFLVHAQSFEKVHRLAEALGIQEEYIRLSRSPAEASVPELDHMEAQLYRYPIQAYEGPVPGIELFSGMQIQSEVEHLAARISALVRERHWRYKEIAVIAGDMEAYGPFIKRTFDEYRIPFFLDQKNPLLDNPVIQWLLLSLRVLERGYRHEDVFMLLKTGFCGIPAEGVERLENYCLQFGITGSRWREPFSLGAALYPLQVLNGIRAAWLTPLLTLEKGLLGRKTTAERTLALYRYIEEAGLQQQLQDWADMLRSRGLHEQVETYGQIWNIVMDSLDQLTEILGDQILSLKDFIRVIQAGFSSLAVGIIPTTLDQVLVGSISRSKSQGIRALFLVGLNDGILPSGQREEGLLGELERDSLRRSGLFLGNTGELKGAEEKFAIYSTLSKPQEHLYLSYALADAEGKAMRPSILAERIRRLFPTLTQDSDLFLTAEQQLQRIAGPESLFKFLVQEMRHWADGAALSSLWSEICCWYLHQEAWTPRLEGVLQALYHRNQEGFVSPGQAARLYPRPIRTSVSRLEQYVRCPFAHLVQYGLRPQERKTYTVAAPDMGELFHRAIEDFTRLLAEEGCSWRALEDAARDVLLDRVLEKVIPDHNHGVLLSSHRYRYLANRLQRITKRALRILTEHVQKGRFEPLGHEIRFGPGGTFPAIEIELPDGEVVYLEGRIDRVDILQEGSEAYLKVIDYKSGTAAFDLSEVYYGLKLQLLVYLHALLKVYGGRENSGAHPAGIFYFKIDDPFVSTQERIAEAAEAEIRRQLKLKGLVLRDVHIVQMMEEGISGTSDILPLALKKDGDFDQRSSVLREEEFLLLLDHVKHTLTRITAEILQGRIRIEPVQQGRTTACQTCAFDGICQFDPRFDDNRYRTLKKLDRDAVISAVKREEGF